MIRGIGTDIIEIQRIENAIARHGKKFLDRIFSQPEQDYCLKHKRSARHFAGRFAAKEAVAKSLGTGIGKDLSWLDIMITNDSHGKPQVKLSSEAKEKFSDPEILISISHSHDYATAFALRE